ncbi:chromosome partitioning protein ParB [Capsulimonas corticalis]|uniref:Chromosome partitioning protein ParB n=1 Tax=Capsulimonas corticalis TaxID=2219043 RepID=A0A402D4A5_9BACT|nr:ParB/RepB/Spo0J family partition protein [Capsulimonas corticalis]BDI29219.1 chromosome partitioning protein ParB [Capsulimonas corticalis]
MERSKPAEKSRLGRGLSSLIPPSARPITATAEEPPKTAPTAEAVPAAPENPQDAVQRLAVTSIRANTFQPRDSFDDAALEDLSNSISAHGILQPIMVRASGKGKYELVAGERRFRAAKRAGLETVPAIVRELTDEESLTVALIENIQREDLNAIEAAKGYRQLLDQFGLTQTELARQLGKAQPTIANALRLLKLDLEMQQSISHGQMSEEHGKALLSLQNEDQRFKLWEKVIANQLSVAETRRLAMKISQDADAEEAPVAPARDVHWIALEDRLRTAFGMKVGLRPSPKGGGTLTIEFSDPEEVEGILDRIR